MTNKRFFSRLTKDRQKPEFFLHTLFLENEEESGEIKSYKFLSIHKIEACVQKYSSVFRAIWIKTFS